MLEVLVAILPVFIIMAVGVVVERSRILPTDASYVLNIYSLRLALPVLILKIMADAEPNELFQGGLWFGLVGAQLLSYAIGYSGDRLLARRGPRPAVISAMAASSSMTSFVGIPVIADLLPGNREAMVVAGIVAIVPTISIALGQVQLEVNSHLGQPSGNKGIGAILMRSVFLNPIVLGMVLGAVMCMMNMRFWAPLGRALDLIGASSSPCILLALGLDIRDKLGMGMRNLDRHRAFRLAAVVFMKLVVHPLLTWAFLSWCGVPATYLAICVIMSSIGISMGCYIVSVVYKTTPEESAAAVVLTSILSLFTLSGFAFVFKTLQYI